MFNRTIQPMKKHHFSIASLALAGTISSQAAIVWTGSAATDDFYDAGNWDFSGSASSAVASPTDDGMTITGATINEPSAAFSTIEVGDGLSVTLDSTSFIFTNNNGFGGVNDVADVISTVSLLNGSSLSAQFASVGIDITVDSTSILAFRGGGDPINSQTEKTTIKLSPGAQLTLPSVAEFTEQGADIEVNGVTFASDNSILSFSGNTANAVPEPTSALLTLLGGLAFFIRRRN